MSFKKKKRIAKDIALNIIASAMPIAILQLFLFPSLASHIDTELYGFIIAVYSMFSLAPGALGNVLNNVRLVHQAAWKSNADAAFNSVLLVLGVISVVVTAGYAVINTYSDYVSLILIGVTTLLWVLREYGSVVFRIALDFKAICINSFVMCLGYVIGYVFFSFGVDWAFIFLFGQFFSCAHILISSNFLSAGLGANGHLKQISKETLQLSGAALMSRAVTYCDRLILYPLLGGGAVAVYYAATIISKLVNMATASLNSVILSYLSKQTRSERRQVVLILLCGLIICLIFYAIILLAAPMILNILYPQFIDAAIMLVPVTTATSLVAVLSSLLSPYLLKFRAMYWQLLTPTLSLIVYAGVALVLLVNFGLIGFCVGALIAEVVKFVVQLLIYFVSKPIE